MCVSVKKKKKNFKNSRAHCSLARLCVGGVIFRHLLYPSGKCVCVCLSSLQCECKIAHTHTPLSLLNLRNFFFLPSFCAQKFHSQQQGQRQPSNSRQRLHGLDRFWPPQCRGVRVLLIKKKNKKEKAI